MGLYIAGWSPAQAGEARWAHILRGGHRFEMRIENFILRGGAVGSSLGS